MIRFICPLIASMLLCGCISNSSAPSPPVEKTSFYVEKLPLVAAVYYSPEFRNHKYTGRAGDAQWGELSVAVFRDGLAALFEKVVEIDAWPIADDSLSFDFLIVPRIASSQFLEISYDITLRNAAGSDIAALKVGERPSPPGQPRAVNMNRLSTVRNAAARFVVGLADHPQIVSRLSGKKSPETVQTGGAAVAKGGASDEVFAAVSLLTDGTTYMHWLRNFYFETCLESALRKNVKPNTILSAGGPGCAATLPAPRFSPPCPAEARPAMVAA